MSLHMIECAVRDGRVTEIELHELPEPVRDALGPAFFDEFARAVAAIRTDERHRHATRARTPIEWAEALCTPARDEQRAKALLRLAGTLMHHGVPPDPVYALLMTWNFCWCSPPLDGDEVEALHRWVTRRNAGVA